eukprot:TRINITY_DN591_c0_g1_i1.p2 TRINITY_DN591_c0_g1~~TRINITY_DN591_c0_g1_i1.p2  ORF type:complete len:277 (+),score=114.31 TRINITY_DN591_c0_g1_i1:74-904(+)
MSDLNPENRLVFLGVAVSAAVVLVGYLLSQRRPKRSVLDPEEWRWFKLQERKDISHNTRLFRFALPKATDVLGLPIGQHLSFRAKDEAGQVFQRSYTPTTSDDELGYFDLVVKVYELGKMSQHLDRMKIGDSIEVRGPKGKFVYQPNMKFSLGMLAGGTGITPMLQVIRAIHKNPQDKTSVSLIFANVSSDDILLKAELDAIAASDKRFKVYYVLNNPPQGWTGGVGFVSQAMIEQHLPAPNADTSILMCGPPMMCKAMSTHLAAIGYTAEMSFTF